MQIKPKFQLRAHRRHSTCLILTAFLFCTFECIGGLFDSANPFKYATKGGPNSGPGEGQSGAMVNDLANDAGNAASASVWANIANLTKDATSIVSSGDKNNTSEISEIQKAIGERVNGIHSDDYKPTYSALDAVYRKQAIENFRAQNAFSCYTPYILYLEAFESHNAKLFAYDARLNALIRANNTPLTLQERLRLSNELSLLGAQSSIEEQIMRENTNRALITANTAHLDSLRNELMRSERRQEAEATTASP